MKLNKVHHIAIICSDYERSKQFYTQTLGLRLIAEHYRSERQSYKADLALGTDYVVELFSFPNPPVRLTHPEAAGLRHLAFETDNIVQAVAELDSYKCHTNPYVSTNTPKKKFVFFQDPDGLPIELYEK